MEGCIGTIDSLKDYIENIPEYKRYAYPLKSLLNVFFGGIAVAVVHKLCAGKHKENGNRAVYNASFHYADFPA